MGHRKGDPRPDEQVNAPRGENARRGNIGRELFMQPKVDMRNPEAINDRYMWYLDKCAEWDDRPTVEGFALATGYDRASLFNIANGFVKSVPQESINTLKRVLNMLNQIMTQYMVDGHLNPVTAIFLLKNNFGYKDQTETVVVKKDPYETGNSEEIARGYLMGMQPSLDAPPAGQENAPLVQTYVVDQTGTVE